MSTSDVMETVNKLKKKYVALSNIYRLVVVRMGSRDSTILNDPSSYTKLGID
jgi:hypothetical protein